MLTTHNRVAEVSPIMANAARLSALAALSLGIVAALALVAHTLGAHVDLGTLAGAFGVILRELAHVASAPRLR